MEFNRKWKFVIFQISFDTNAEMNNQEIFSHVFEYLKSTEKIQLLKNIIIICNRFILAKCIITLTINLSINETFRMLNLLIPIYI